MEKLSFYEQVGILTPGAVLLFGILLYNPELKAIFAKDGISVGGLGIFIIISYAVGHLLAGIGNFIEKYYWKFHNGMPSNWIIGSSPKLLFPSQISKIESMVSTRLGLTVSFSGLTEREWHPIFRQIYSDIEKNGKPNRADIFNGNYGLNRGLCASTFVLSLFVFFHSFTIGLLLMGASAMYLFRMHRFGVLYAREVYIQFILLPPNQNPPS